MTQYRVHRYVSPETCKYSTNSYSVLIEGIDIILPTLPSSHVIVFTMNSHRFPNEIVFTVSVANSTLCVNNIHLHPVNVIFSKRTLLSSEHQHNGLSRLDQAISDIAITGWHIVIFIDTSTEHLNGYAYLVLLVFFSQFRSLALAILPTKNASSQLQRLVIQSQIHVRFLN